MEEFLTEKQKYGKMEEFSTEKQENGRTGE